MPKDTKMWQDRIKDGQRFQQKFAQSKQWQQYKSYYRHEFKAGQVPVNLMFSILRSMVPQVYFRNPKVTITPRKPGLEAELNARIVQKLDNWLLREISIKRELKKMVEDTFFCGTAAGFHGYDSLYGYAPKLLDSSGQFTLSQFNSTGDRIETNANVSPGMPWFLRSRPDDVVYPHGSTSQDTLDWVAFRVFRALSDVKADKKYSNQSDLTGTQTPIRTGPEGAESPDVLDKVAGDGDDEQWVELWQVHDVRRRKVIVLTMDHDKLLRDDKDDLQIDGLPLETLTFNPDPDYIYGIPDARIIEPQLLELIEIRTQAMKHRRLDILKGLVKKGAMTPENIMKLTSEDVMALAEVETEFDIKQAFAPVNPGVSGILQDLALAGELVRGDIRETVGFSRNSSGEYQGKTHISAEETSRVFQAANIRLDERRDAVADLLTNVVRRFNQQIFTNWTQERVAQVIGPDGAKWWLKFTGPQIKDEYDLAVEPEEGAPLDSESKKQLTLQLAEVWAKLNQGAIAQGLPIPGEIQRALFNQFDELGVDIDKLGAQSMAISTGAQAGIAAQGGGQSPQTAISPQLLAQIQSQGGRS